MRALLKISRKILKPSILCNQGKLNGLLSMHGPHKHGYTDSIQSLKPPKERIAHIFYTYYIGRILSASIFFSIFLWLVHYLNYIKVILNGCISSLTVMSFLLLLRNEDAL